MLSAYPDHCLVLEPNISHFVMKQMNVTILNL